MKIMKQANNMVSTIKLPAGQYTQTGREPLKELPGVHFPESTMTDDSNNGQGQQKFDV
jgi:hypothetical protein